jgi:small subunit ribosomal protein S17
MEQDKVKIVRTYVGEVVSDKMDKTIVVKVVRTVQHKTFGKVVDRSKRYKAHDEKKEAKVGDFVMIEECRPFSKTKHTKLVKIVKKDTV